MKKFRKLIPALAMLLVSAVLMSTASYAWFSMNTQVTATGMEVKVSVSSNLYIDKFVGGSWATNDSTFAASVTDSITTQNKLVPVSTVSGTDGTFYFTDPTNVTAQGDAVAETYTLMQDKAAGFANLKAAYPSADAGYIDYHFILKAENTSASAMYINLTKCQLKYTGAKDTSTAFRIAVIAGDLASAVVDGAKTASTTMDKVVILTQQGTVANFTSGQAVSSTSGTAAVTYGGASTIDTVAANKTEYKEVIIRIWLEGEDKTCNVSVFNDLAAGLWSLDVGFQLNTTNNGNVTTFTKLTSFTSTTNTTAYVCDGTNVYLATDTELATALTASAIGNATVESELENAFGISIS